MVYILSKLANLNISKYQCNYLNFIPKNPDVSTTNTTKTYYGLAGTTFKKRYGVIEVTYKIEKTMELCKYVWFLRNNNFRFDLKWSIKKKAQVYSAGAKY